MTWNHPENYLVDKKTESEGEQMNWGSQEWLKVDGKLLK